VLDSGVHPVESGAFVNVSYLLEGLLTLAGPRGEEIGGGIVFRFRSFRFFCLIMVVILR